MTHSDEATVNLPTGGALVETNAALRLTERQHMNSLIKIASVCAIALTTQLFAESVFANPELMKAKNCTACHAIDKKVLGPSFKDIAAKYATDAKAVETLAGRVKGGSGGVWGNIPMPANPQVTSAEAETLVKWILAQK